MMNKLQKETVEFLKPTSVKMDLSEGKFGKELGLFKKLEKNMWAAYEVISDLQSEIYKKQGRFKDGTPEQPSKDFDRKRDFEGEKPDFLTDMLAETNEAWKMTKKWNEVWKSWEKYNK
jgi:hypothetical protein